jgi:16S rRNA (guanine527-N7)-methyltransferase
VAAELVDVPAAAAAVFGDALPQAVKYASLLSSAGVERGIVGPGEAARIWDRHLLNCAVVAHLIPAKATVIDVGSGAGLPGLVLAMLRPAAMITLVEPLARRVAFLGQCVTELGLANVEVVRSRAEDLAGQLWAEVVTARAVAPLEKLAGMCLGVTRPGGKVLAIKGASAAAELARARPALASVGVTDARVVTLGDETASATVVVLSAPERPVAQGRMERSRRPPGPQTGRPGDRGRGPAGKSRRDQPNSRRGG